VKAVPDQFSVIAAELPGGQMVLSVTGEVDVVTAAVLDRVITSLDDGAERVVVDMSRVSFIDSTGSLTLTEIRRRLRQAGRELLVVDPSPFVSRVLAMTGTADLVRPIASIPAHATVPTSATVRIPASVTAPAASAPASVTAPAASVPAASWVPARWDLG